MSSSSMPFSPPFCIQSSLRFPALKLGRSAVLAERRTIFRVRGAAARAPGAQRVDRGLEQGRPERSVSQATPGGSLGEGHHRVPRRLERLVRDYGGGGGTRGVGCGDDDVCSLYLHCFVYIYIS